MRVIEAFKAFNTESYDVKYFNCVRGLGFKSYVCQLCVILIYVLF